MTVSLGSDGWTQFTASADSRIVYVSASGSDANDGLSQGAPKATIAAGKALLRAGMPDWLLLKKGDTWVENLGQIKVSGRSADEPMLISSYGTGSRPLLKATRTARGTPTAFGGGGGSAGGNYLAIVDLDFYGHEDDPSGPEYVTADATACSPHIKIINTLNWLLIEGCRFRFGPVEIEPGVNSPDAVFTFRRNVSVDSYESTGSGHKQGLYTGNVGLVIVEDSVFDHNGWHETVGVGPTEFNHNVYLQTSNGVALVRNNIFARGSSHGIQQRPGGLCFNNLAVNNAIGILVGGDATTAAIGQALYNVVLESKDITEALPKGMGVEIKPVSGGGTMWRMADNIIAHGVASAVNERGGTVYSTAVGAEVARNIVYDHGAGIEDQGTGTIQTGNVVDGSGYADPGRSVASYAASLGLTASLAAFMTEARLQSKDNWRTAYTAAVVNDYIRAGFGVSVANPIRLRLT